MTKPTITILGTGYVGLTTAAIFANAGYKVYAVEPNKERLDVIKTGKSFFFENGLDPVVKKAVDSGNLIATDSYAESVPNSTIVFSSVGTPDNPDGSSNLTYVFSAAKEAASHMPEDSIYVQKSTVPVGTGRQIEELFKNEKKLITYTSNPEFLREGTALFDTLYFDRVVVGGDNPASVKIILDLYREVEKHRDSIAATAGITPHPRKGQYIATNLNSAELIKVTANAFLALKISFANSIAKLADKVNADITEVMDAVGADERIGRAFLNAGRGYGGGCFPKDVSGLIASSNQYGVDLDIMQAAQDINASMPDYVVERLSTKLDGSINGKTIAVLGLAFKAGTSDARRSPGVAIANLLANNSTSVNAYDPQANEEAKEELSNSINLYSDIEKTVKSANAIIIATEWPEFAEMITPEWIGKHSNATVIIDAVNRLDSSAFSESNITYLGIGRR